jgi:O-antigen ligase
LSYRDGSDSSLKSPSMARLHQILDRIVFYGLLTTIVVTAVPYGSAQLWWTALFECLIFVLAIVALVDLIITKDTLPAGSSIAFPLLVLCLFLLFQSLPLFASDNSVIQNLRLSISADPFTTQLLAVKLFALIVTGVLLLRYADTEARVRTLVYVVIAVGVASGLLGILRRTSGGPNWFFPLPRPELGFAQFVNRNHFGFLMEMTFGVALGFAVKSTRDYRRWLLFLPIAAFLWISLVIANSRGAILASLCQVLFLGLLVDPAKYFVDRSHEAPMKHLQTAGRWAVRVIVAVVLIVVFAVGLSWVGGERVTSNIELASTAYDQPALETRANARRKQIWSATWNMFKSHPVFGTGLGGYWIAITKYHDASGEMTPQEAHNDYLEVLASGGLVGATLIVWFVARLANYSRGLVRSATMSAAALGALIGICGVLIHSFFDFGLHIMANAVVFSVLIVIGIINPRSPVRTLATR